MNPSTTSFATSHGFGSACHAGEAEGVGGKELRCPLLVEDVDLRDGEPRGAQEVDDRARPTSAGSTAATSVTAAG
jgi:hypothetical protein